MEKRYYWLKLKDDFFGSKRIKKLRRMPGGDKLLVIYLKMQLKAVGTDGVLTYTGLESDFAEELALDLDESTEDVKLLLSFLQTYGMCVKIDDEHYLLPFVQSNTGSETASAQRVRKSRARGEEQRNAELLQSGTDALQCNSLVTNCNSDVTNLLRDCSVEKEIDIDIDDDEDDREIHTRAREEADEDQWSAKYRAAEALIDESYHEHVGRAPLPEERAFISRSVVLLPSGGLVDQAITEAAARGVESIAPYVVRILDNWSAAKVTNEAELVKYNSRIRGGYR